MATFNRKKQKKGKPLAYNQSLRYRYEKALRGLVKKMGKDVKKEVMKLFKSDVSDTYFDKQEDLASVETMDASLASQARILMNKLTREYTELFDDKALELAKTMVFQADKSSKSALKSSLSGVIEGFTLDFDFIPSSVKEVAKAAIAENVSLISSVPEQYLKNITGSVMRSITSGAGVQELEREMTKYYGQAYRRAKNVALDQTRKAYNTINKQRMMSAGFKKFEWLHSGGGLQPRKHHQAMDGKIYSFDDLPVIVPETGEKGIPGQATNCGCTMRPIYEFPEGEK